MRRRFIILGLFLSNLLLACGPSGTETTGGVGGGSGGTGGGGAGGTGGTTVDSRFDALIEAVEAERKELGAPGCAVAVIEDGKVTFARGFGSKDPNADVPVEATTLFRIGSVNKMLTAAGLLVQVAKGNVDLDAPVTNYVPEFHFDADPTWADQITSRHLLTHSSAMFDYLKIDGDAWEKKDDALDVYMTGPFASVDYLMAPPGAFWNYSNPNYYMAGLVAEKSSQKLYRDLMQQDVFEPLGMTRTFFKPGEVLLDGDYAIGKAGGFPGIPDTIYPDTYDNAWARPAGYASSSVLDLAKFVQFLLDGNEAVLPKALVEEMQSPQINTQLALDLVHYGYGLQVQNGAFLGGPDKFYGVKVVQHGGDIPGFAAILLYIPELKFGFVGLSSASGARLLKSAVAAITTLAPLPAPSATVPDFTVDPTTFDAFTGTYMDPFNVGEIIVTHVGDSLQVSMPALDQANIAYDPVLATYTPNNFILNVDGGSMPVTFLQDDTGTFRYFRTRVFVGARPDTMPPAPPLALTGERKSRFLSAVREPAELPELLVPRKLD